MFKKTSVIAFATIITCALSGWVAVAASDTSNSQKIRSGISLYQNQQYHRAFRQLYHLSSLGNKVAQYYIGRMLLEGNKTIRKDIVRGRTLLELSAKQNYQPALKYRMKLHLGSNINISLKSAENLCKQGIIEYCYKKAEIMEKQPDHKSQVEACNIYQALYADRQYYKAAYHLAACNEKKIISTTYQTDKLLKFVLNNIKKTNLNINRVSKLLLNHYQQNYKVDKTIVDRLIFAQNILKGRGYFKDVSDLARQVKNQSFNDAQCLYVVKGKSEFWIVDHVCRSAMANSNGTSFGILAEFYENRKPERTKEIFNLALQGSIMGDKKSINLLKKTDKSSTNKDETNSYFTLPLNTKAKAAGDKLCQSGIGLGCYYLAKEILHKMPEADSKLMAEAVSLLSKGSKYGDSDASYMCWKMGRKIMYDLESIDNVFSESLRVARETNTVCEKFMIQQQHKIGLLEWAEGELSGFFVSDSKTSRVCRELKTIAMKIDVFNQSLADQYRSILSKCN